MDWAYQRAAAQHAIEKLAGVTYIFNQIVLITRPVLASIKEKIKAAMLRDASLDAYKIKIALNGDKAISTGVVRSLAEKTMANLRYGQHPE